MVVCAALLALAAPASADTFCVQKSTGCEGSSKNNLAEALDSALATVGRDRIELGAYIDTGTPVVAVNNPVDIVGSGQSSIFQGGGGGSARLKIVEPSSTVSDIRIIVTGDNSIGLDTRGPARNITVTADLGATHDLVGVLLSVGGTLDQAGIFLPMTGGATIQGVRTELPGVSKISNATIEAEKAILAFKGGTPGPANRTVVTDVFLRAAVGIVANGSDVTVDNAEVEAPATAAVGLQSFTGAASAAIRARHVTVVGTGAASSNGVTAFDFDGAGPLTASVDLRNSIVSGFATDLRMNGPGAAITANWSRFASVSPVGGVAGSDNTAAEPGFVDPVARNYRLAAGSAMIDAGDPAALAADEPALDIQGLPRPVDGDGDCGSRRDIGANEFQPGQRAPRNVTAAASPSSAAAGEAIGFTAAACDPDGDALTFTWSFDDGTAATGASVSKAFATGGTHTATVTAGDPGGRTAGASTTVSIAAPPPVPIVPIVPTGPTGPTGPTVPATVSILSFSMLRSSFAVGTAATPVAAAKKPAVGSAFRFRLSGKSTVTITVRQLTGGRRSKGRCVKPTAKLRKAKKCTLAVKRGTLRRKAKAGNNTVTFSGRIGTKALAPGAYVAALAAKGAKSRSVRFKIVKRR
jgi:PKD repeat protein